MFSQIGPLEIVLVLAIALIVLGPKRLPDAGRSVGRGIRNFKGALTGDDEPGASPSPRSSESRANGRRRGRCPSAAGWRR